MVVWRVNLRCYKVVLVWSRRHFDRHGRGRSCRGVVGVKEGRELPVRVLPYDTGARSVGPGKGVVTYEQSRVSRYMESPQWDEKRIGELPALPSTQRLLERCDKLPQHQQAVTEAKECVHDCAESEVVR